MARSEAHKRYQAKKEAEWAAMPPIPCTCGCGTMIPPINKRGKPAQYVSVAHAGRIAGQETRFTKGQPAWNKGIPNTHAMGRGKSPETVAKTIETRLRNSGGVWHTKRWTHTPEAKARMSVAQKARKQDLNGEKNPFYGKSHTKETKAILSVKMSGEGSPNFGRKHTDEARSKMGRYGEDHPHWKGGVGPLPYGPGFTRKFKSLIRERDGNTCQRCGKTQASGARPLDIHHIDHDRLNNDLANLVTVCHPCNMWLSWHRSEPFIRVDPL